MTLGPAIETAETRRCIECGTRKPTEDFIEGRHGLESVCRSCKYPEEPEGPTPESEAKRPTTEQLEQIRKLSMVVYGREGDKSTSGLAFKKHGMPQTRAAASDLIKTLQGMRGEDFPDEKPATPKEEPVTTTNTKKCASCKEDQPIDRFRYDGRTADRRAKVCNDCRRSSTIPPAKRSETTAPVTSGGQAEPEKEEGAPIRPASSPPVNGDWRELFRNPRLSQLEQLQTILAEVAQIDKPTLETAGAVARGIADLEWP